MQEARVLIVDDHVLVRKGLVRLLEGFGFSNVLEADNGKEAIDIADRERPDLVLMDVEMPEIDGIEACRHIRSSHPDGKIIMLTMHSEDECLFQAVKAGAIGYVLKNHAPQHLQEVMENALDGQPRLDPQLASRIMKEFSAVEQKEKERADLFHKVTNRERAVLKLVAQGMANKEIAKALFISEHTVKHHLNNVFEKLHINHRTEAAVIAVRKKLV